MSANAAGELKQHRQVEVDVNDHKEDGNEKAVADRVHFSRSSELSPANSSEIITPAKKRAEDSFDAQAFRQDNKDQRHHKGAAQLDLRRGRRQFLENPLGRQMTAERIASR